MRLRPRRQIANHKSPSRPDAPAEAIAEAVRLAIEKESDHPNLDLVCGTTVGTNALLERRGGRVALVTTAGFEDVLEIGRQARSNLYDLFVKKTEPLASLRLGVKERIAADGSIIQALNKKEIARILRTIRKAKPDSIALCFLFSFRNATHEKQIAAALRAKNYSVSVSHEILPEYREYERTSTTVINAYLVPVMSGYLRDTTLRIAALMRDNKKRQSKTNPTENPSSSSVRIMQSNGGIISAEQAAREPVRTILSGPAGGVIGAGHAAKLARLDKCISFDMGGTSTDVALLTGELRTTSEAIVAGLPVAVPMLEIHTVGAGGGSIARFDEGGALRVGPESAGAVPGPICYGRGTNPTVTDAHAVLGHLGNGGLLGGTFPLDIARAREYMQREIKNTRGSFRTVEAFAEGHHRRCQRRHGKSHSRHFRGTRPRSARLHAHRLRRSRRLARLRSCRRARNAQRARARISRRIIRARNSPRRRGERIIANGVAPAEEIIHRRNRLSAMLNSLQREGARVLRAEGFERNKMRFHHSLDMRYRGQAYELNVPARRKYCRRISSRARNALRLSQRESTSGNRKHPLSRHRNHREAAAGKLATRKQSERAASTQTLQLIFDGRPQKRACILRDDLRAGDIFSGPAVVAEYSATTLVPPGWKARVDAYGQLILSRASR